MKAIHTGTRFLNRRRRKLLRRNTVPEKTSGRYSTSPCIKKLSNTQIAVCNIEDTTVTYGWRVEGYLNSEEY